MSSISNFAPGSWIHVNSGWKSKEGTDRIKSPVFIIYQQKGDQSKTTLFMDQNQQLLLFNTDTKGGIAPHGTIDCSNHNSLERITLSLPAPLTGKISSISLNMNLQPIVEKAIKIRKTFLDSPSYSDTEYFKLPLESSMTFTLRSKL